MILFFFKQKTAYEMFGYFEADDLDAAEHYLSEQEVCTRWQDAMHSAPRLSAALPIDVSFATMATNRERGSTMRLLRSARPPRTVACSVEFMRSGELTLRS